LIFTFCWKKREFKLENHCVFLFPFSSKKLNNKLLLDNTCSACCEKQKNKFNPP